MSNRTFPLIGGRVMRVTKEDACGRPAWGDKVQAASEGFVSVAVTANYDDGQDITVTNANGKKCVNKAAEPELTNLSVDVTFCEVDPEVYTAVTGFPPIYDPESGDTIGFKVNRGVRPGEIRWALETWSSAVGSVGCEGDEDVPYGYNLWPFLSGARIGDFTIENNAVTFVASGAVTNDGTLWGVGPYNVVLDDSGDPAPLTDPLDTLDHQITLRTLVPPPEATNGLIPLDDPDSSAATTATAGSPGVFNGRRPMSLSGMSGVTASPATAWTTGQHVILGDGTLAHWSSSAWVAGKA